MLGDFVDGVYFERHANLQKEMSFTKWRKEGNKSSYIGSTGDKRIKRFSCGSKNSNCSY
jgi:hypothetical protein